MNFNKETLNTFSDYLSKGVVLIAPGMMVIEFVFHKGFFSGGISNIPDLFLLLIWSICLSVPYYVCTTLILIWHELDSFKMAEEAKTDPSIYETALPLTLLLVFITYISYKMLMFWNLFAFISNYDIQQKYAVCFVAFIFTILVCFLIAKIYYAIVNAFLTLAAKRIAKKESKVSKKPAA